MSTGTASPATPPAAGPPTSRRVRTPTVLQMEAVECGAAALGIILGYHGRYVPLEELRVACGVSRDGSKANFMLRAARGYGLEGRGLRKEPGDLRAMKTPFVVFWNFNHFLVVEGFVGERVYLNDPASGPRTVTYQEFDDSFTGVVLTFAPGPEFQRNRRPPGLLSALGKRLRGSESALSYVLLAGLALVIPGLALPAFTQIFVDDYLVARQTNWLGPLLIGMALTALVRYGLAWVQQQYLTRMETKLALASAGGFLWHVLHLPVEFFSQRASGDVSARVALNDRVAQLLSGDLATTALHLVVVVFYALVMLRYNALLTLIGVGMAGLNFAVLSLVARGRVDGNRRLLQQQAKMNGTAVGGLQGIETLKSTGTESDFFARWAGYQARAVTSEQDLGLLTQGVTAVPTLLTALNTAVILGIGGLQVMSGAMTIGALVAFQSLMSSFMAPVGQFVALGNTLQETEGAMNRLDDVLRYPSAPGLDEDGQSEAADLLPPKLSGQLEVRGVTFGYSPLAPPLIENFSLTMRPGDRVALVGGSGSGKSTVAKIVSGLYAPWSGEVLLDGRPRDTLPRRVLANSLAVVDQDIFLFEGSVADNVCLWDETVDEASIVVAAKDARIHEDIAARPGGYDSLVAEAGRNLSGGQRQRIEIARALAINPSLVVLDEATAALDPVTELGILESLRRRGCTCLIIAHRLSTIRDCDEIIVLEGGKVVQRGTHDELRAAEGTYARLITAH